MDNAPSIRGRALGPRTVERRKYYKQDGESEILNAPRSFCLPLPISIVVKKTKTKKQFIVGADLTSAHQTGNARKRQDSKKEK